MCTNLGEANVTWAKLTFQCTKLSKSKCMCVFGILVPLVTWPKWYMAIVRDSTCICCTSTTSKSVYGLKSSKRKHSKCSAFRFISSRLSALLFSLTLHFLSLFSHRLSQQNGFPHREKNLHGSAYSEQTHSHRILGQFGVHIFAGFVFLCSVVVYFFPLLLHLFVRSTENLT